ncbi:MAG: hypothetical protein M1839_003556 [Geoglossum umbratile]|nr:MAG: hypothetical protein M1839_003556 [Geoglossum umbratile]
MVGMHPAADNEEISGPSNPLCYTYSFATIDYRNFGCSTRSYLSIVYLDATDTPSGPVTSTTRITSTSDTSTTRITSITSTPSTASPTSTTAASSTPTSIAISGTIPPSATATSSSSPKPVGAIVGGVVGGVAIIGIFAAVIAWIVFKKRGQSDQPAAVPPTDYGNPPPNQGIYAPQPVLAPQYPVGNQPYGMAQAPNPGFGYQQPGVYPAKMELDSSPTSTTPGSPAPAYGAFGR